MAEQPTKSSSAKSQTGPPPKSADQVKRQELVKQRQQERRKAYERNRQAWLITKIVAVVLLVLIVGGLVYYIYDRASSPDPNEIPANVQTFNYGGGQHDDAYNAWTESPPVGGVHNNSWQECGYYATELAKGKAVHSMEHGAVWITYQPELSQDQIDKLKSLAEKDDYILVSPYPGQDSPVIANSWNHQLKLDSASNGDLDQFILVFKQSPKYTPEPGARC